MKESFAIFTCTTITVRSLRSRFVSAWATWPEEANGDLTKEWTGTCTNVRRRWRRRWTWGKSEKHERRSSGKKEANSGESANEEDGAHAYVHACSHRVDEDEEERRKRGRRMIGENVGNDGKGRAGMKSEEKNETFRRSRAMVRRLVSLLLFSLSFLPSRLSLPRTLACSSTLLLLLHIHDFILCSAWRKRANVAEPRTADFLRSRSHLWRDNLVPKSRCRWSWISTSLAGKRVK